MDTEVLNGNDSVDPYKLHVERGQETPVMNQCKTEDGGELFWVVTLVGAYQYHYEPYYDHGYDRWVSGTYDPPFAAGGGPIGVTLGLAATYRLPPPNDPPGTALVFCETIRDWMEFETMGGWVWDWYDHVALHELGHLLGGRHEDGGIMGTSGSPGTGFTGKSHKRFMLIPDEGPSHH